MSLPWTKEGSTPALLISKLMHHQSAQQSYSLWKVSAYAKMVETIHEVCHCSPHYTYDLHTGNPAPFLYTPTSLLPEHSVLTDVQQATGRNGQQWITCRSGGEGNRPEIWMGNKEIVLSNSSNNSSTIVLNPQYLNGLYHCLTAQSQREYFSLFLSNGGKHQMYNM